MSTFNGSNNDSAWENRTIGSCIATLLNNPKNNRLKKKLLIMIEKYSPEQFNQNPVLETAFKTYCTSQTS